MEVLHAREICVDPAQIKEDGGRSATTRSRSVTCACGRAGIVASAGYEHVIRIEWARRNGYSYERNPVTGQYEVWYTGGRGEVPGQ